MSRIGKQPIVIPSGVEVILEGKHTVIVKGTKGTLSRVFNSAVSFWIEEKDGQKQVVLTITKEDDKDARAQWGTARSVLANMIHGVAEGFSKQLEVNGVGYRVNLSGNTLVLHVGYSHEVPFLIPEGIEMTVENNLVTIKGADKELVGETAARIRKIRKPEPYKGKGIKYVDEVIRRKAGKSAKAGE